MTVTQNHAGQTARQTVPQQMALGLIRGYQQVISPSLGTTCRFAPSCSHYAAEAIEVHGLVRGIWLSVRRIARCRPGGGSGLDAVQPVKASRAVS